MVAVVDTVRRLLAEQGRTQVWVIQKMNRCDPEINMDRSKFSAIITGRRKMSGDELLAFCKALEIAPDEFLRPRMPEKEVV
ncbi:helix-turn-helix transcriptional regulator [Lachnospiraceae bacterium 29-91]